MATGDKENAKEPTSAHFAIRNANIGSKKDGSPKRVINKGEKLELTDNEVKAYRLNKIIK